MLPLPIRLLAAATFLLRPRLRALRLSVAIMSLGLFLICAGAIHGAGISPPRPAPEPPATSDGPGLVILPEFAVIDADEYFQVVGGYLEPGSQATLQVTLQNTGPAPIDNINIVLHPRPEWEIDILSPAVNLASIAPGASAAAHFRVRAGATPPGLYALDITGSSSAGPIDAEAVLLVASVELDLDGWSAGTVGITIEGPDGRYIGTLNFNPASMSLPPTAGFECPMTECIQFIPATPFAGIHPPAWPGLVRGDTSFWVKKLLSGLVNFLGGNAVGIGRDLGAQGFTERAIAKVIKRVGIKRAAAMFIARLTPGIGWIMLAYGVAAAVVSALAADPPGHDFFVEGQLQTPPPPGLLTTMEEACFQFSLCEPGPLLPTHITGQRTYRRTLSDQSVLVYEEPFDLTLNTVLQVNATTNQPIYSLGQQIVVEATVMHPTLGQLRGGDAVVTASVRQPNSQAHGVILTDLDGNGTYSGSFLLDVKMLCAGGGPATVDVLAQRTTQGFMDNSRPDWYAGMQRVPVSFNGAVPMPDLGFSNFNEVPDAAAPGEILQVSAAFMSAGTAPSPPAPWEILLSADLDPSPTAVILASGALPPAPPGATIPIQAMITIPMSASPGPMYLLFRADPDGAVVECNETNNSGIWPLDIVVPCYPNCDFSTIPPILNVDDFTCFINQFAAASALPHAQQLNHYANCDHSTIAPVLNVDDFICFINAFAQGCP